MTSPDEIKQGMKVKTLATVARYGSEGYYDQVKGMCIAPKHLEIRTPETNGTVQSYVGGHGGDVWWVTHEDGSVGAYAYNEFERA